MNITLDDVNRTVTAILDLYRKSLASGRDSFKGWLSTYDKLSGLSMLFINDSEIYDLIVNAIQQLDVIQADHENRLKTQEIAAEVDQELTANVGQGVQPQSLMNRPSLKRLSELAKKHALRVARSDSDCMRVAICSEFEYIAGIAWPWSIFPNATQAYRALKQNYEVHP